MRIVIKSAQFDEFYNALPSNVQKKVDYALNIISSVKVVTTKLVKNLVGTEFYELRVSVGNEYRVIIFTIDSDSFIESGQIILLNGFMKKSTKDYRKEIEKARTIIKNLE